MLSAYLNEKERICVCVCARVWTLLARWRFFKIKCSITVVALVSVLFPVVLHHGYTLHFTWLLKQLAVGTVYKGCVLALVFPFFPSMNV